VVVVVVEDPVVEPVVEAVVEPDVDPGAPALPDPPQPARSRPAAISAASHRVGRRTGSRIAPVKTGASSRQTSVDRDRTRRGDAKTPKPGVRHGLVKAIFGMAALG
jgi:hypothetical protein